MSFNEPSRKYLFRGDYRSLEYIGEKLGLTSRALRKRLRKGETPEKAFTPPRGYTASRRLYTVNGETMSLQAWAVRIGLSEAGLKERLCSGLWTEEQALTTPWMRLGHSRKRLETRKPVILRLPLRIDTNPGGTKAFSKEVLGTGGGRHAPETAHSENFNENENQPMRAMP